MPQKFVQIDAGFVDAISGTVAFNYAQCTVKMLKNANYVPQNAANAKCYRIFYVSDGHHLLYHASFHFPSGWRLASHYNVKHLVWCH